MCVDIKDTSVNTYKYVLIDNTKPSDSAELPWPHSPLQLFVGVLRGFDQSSNVVLSDCQESRVQ